MTPLEIAKSEGFDMGYQAAIAVGERSFQEDRKNLDRCTGLAGAASLLVDIISVYHKMHEPDKRRMKSETKEEWSI